METLITAKTPANQNFMNSFQKLEQAATTITSKDKKCNEDRLKPLRVLLVEDSEIIRKVNLYLLKSLDFEVELAIDGFEALRKITNSYDLILLDIELPSHNGISKNGLDVAKSVRNYEKKHNVKPSIIIALTSFDSSIKNDCLAAGCNDFYEKPLSILKLKEVIQRWLK